jgi:hypothetical protein
MIKNQIRIYYINENYISNRWIEVILVWWSITITTKGKIKNYPCFNCDYNRASQEHGVYM